ncbi:uncharacterized protein L201_001505 [Kwoniella dendrophila CBS 6074]|uniref:Uncharacterized protein n=1 Tax=Kwoniella dendrophila CBS 6074 TaxID=1295534 RepID=A0AAX4JP11_9TREE
MSPSACETLMEAIDNIIATNPSEELYAYNALWKINRELFPGNIASITSDSHRNDWYLGEITDQSFFSVLDVRSLYNSISVIIMSTDPADESKKEFEGSLSYFLVEADKRIKERNRQLSKIWNEETPNDPEVQKFVNGTDDEVDTLNESSSNDDSQSSDDSSSDWSKIVGPEYWDTSSDEQGSKAIAHDLY